VSFKVVDGLNSNMRLLGTTWCCGKRVWFLIGHSWVWYSQRLTLFHWAKSFILIA